MFLVAYLDGSAKDNFPNEQTAPTCMWAFVRALHQTLRRFVVHCSENDTITRWHIHVSTSNANSQHSSHYTEVVMCVERQISNQNFCKPLSRPYKFLLGSVSKFDSPVCITFTVIVYIRSIFCICDGFDVGILINSKPAFTWSIQNFWSFGALRLNQTARIVQDTTFCISNWIIGRLTRINLIDLNEWLIFHSKYLIPYWFQSCKYFDKWSRTLRMAAGRDNFSENSCDGAQESRSISLTWTQIRIICTKFDSAWSFGLAFEWYLFHLL